MFKLVGLLLVIFSVLNSEVSGQSATLTTITSVINTYRANILSSLISPFNNLRDDMYGHFYRSQNIIDDVQNNLFSAGQRFPYFILTQSVRDELTGNIASFLSTCSRPTVQYLNENAVIPLFDYTSGNNTMPIENAIKPISDVLDRILTAATQATNQTCLASLAINNARLRTVLSPAVSQISGCLSSTFATLRTPVNAFVTQHFTAFRQFNTLVNSFQSCTSIFTSNRTACVITVTPSLCSTPTDTTCTICGAIQSLKTQATAIVSQAQDLLSTCYAKTAATITTADALITSIQSCQTLAAADTPSEENDIVVEEQNRSESLDEKAPKSMQIGADEADYDYVSVY